ncbi:MAG TPA: hypothetical protein VHV30_11895 [Polyangiaceae bacterium]|jgi:hypothetical protein|nr:hypothetical protein [Polyangiaceae bacterium]
MSQHPTFDSLFEDAVLASYAKQAQLATLIGNRRWDFDMDTGVLTFGGEIAWKTQILGTESQSTGTWLWAWANAASNIPPGLVASAKLLAEKGKEWGIPELTERERRRDGRFNGHAVAMIACQLAGGASYYRGPYDGGAIYLLITDASFPRATDDPQALAALFPKAISVMPFHHRNAFLSYVRQQGWTVKQDETRSSVLVEGKPAVALTFDRLGRLTGIEATLRPAG